MLERIARTSESAVGIVAAGHLITPSANNFSFSAITAPNVCPPSPERKLRQSRQMGSTPLITAFSLLICCRQVYAGAQAFCTFLVGDLSILAALEKCAAIYS